MLKNHGVFYKMILKKNIFAKILLAFISLGLFSEPTAVKFSKADFPKIETPKQQSLKQKKQEKYATNQEELEKIRRQNEKIEVFNENVRKENEIWNQYQKDLEKSNKIKNLPPKFKKNTDEPKNLFYIYVVKKDSGKYLDNFLGLYARFQTTQGTLASINRLSSPADIEIGMELILPVNQGLYIPKNAKTALEILLQKEFSPLITDDTKIYEIDGTEFYFLDDKNFSSTAFSFFHDKGMQLPLSKKIVTSEFGYRTSPISGKWKFHAGVDLAAPVGTEVFACKSGKVIVTNENHEIYGKYIDIKHDGNTVSRYAHLSKILVKKGQIVSTGQTIGLVGTTGASTGPHLHFEVRENGSPKDPLKEIKSKK